MNELEYVGKIKGMKTLKQMIESKDVMPASQLAKNKAAVEAQEKTFEEAARSQSRTVKPRSPPVKWRGAIIGRVSHILGINPPYS